MKISEMIRRLQVLQEIAGDVEVCVYSIGDMPHVESAIAELDSCIKVSCTGATKIYNYEAFEFDDDRIEQVVTIY